MNSLTLEQSPTIAAQPAEHFRPIVHCTRGRGHGGITRLMSPSDLGHWVKPFVFLDHFDDSTMRPGTMPLHPHSGIATLTYLIEGAIRYEDTTGKAGTLPAGGVEWMMAGGGVWHTGGPASSGASSCGWQCRRNWRTHRRTANTWSRRRYRRQGLRKCCWAGMVTRAARLQRPPL